MIISIKKGKVLGKSYNLVLQKPILLMIAVLFLTPAISQSTFATHTSPPASATSGDGIVPDLYEKDDNDITVDFGGNPSCFDLGYDNELKMENVVSGSVNDIFLTLTITVTSTNPTVFSWGTNFDIPAIIAKGGPSAFVYTYNPEDNGDAGLGFPMGSSHISACYDVGSIPPEMRPIGGEIFPINTTSLLLAGIQTNLAWIIPIALSAAGIGVVLVRKRT